jgi:hypothetical protein
MNSLESRDTQFKLLVAMASMNGCEDENIFACVGYHYERLFLLHIHYVPLACFRQCIFCCFSCRFILNISHYFCAIFVPRRARFLQCAVTLLFTRVEPMLNFQDLIQFLLIGITKYTFLCGFDLQKHVLLCNISHQIPLLC